MRSIGILGAGSFGTALAIHAARAERRVVLWARRPELVEAMAAERVNPDYLPGVELPARLEPSADLAAVAACEVVLVAVPSHGFREAVRALLAVHEASRPAILVSATKGIEVETQARMSEVVFEEGMAADREVRYAVLSGPSFAAELGRGMATAAVLASSEPGLAAWIQEELASASLRLYTSSDVVGVELGGASKNVIAIAAGVVSGLGLGYNTQAALITRGSARDHPPRRRLRRPAADLRRARRPRRPGAHLHRRPVAQPPSRHRPGGGQDAGRDHRHPHGGGGDPQLAGGGTAGTQAGRRDADHRADGGDHLRGQAAAAGARRADDARAQSRSGASAAHWAGKGARRDGLR